MAKPDLNSKQLPATVEPRAAHLPGVQTLKLTAICLGLVVLVLWGFLPSLRNGFVNYDDPIYVSENVHVQHGLTLESIKWAFLNPVAWNWHPLTVLSHMVDCQLFGLKPWGHHLTSLWLHALNTLLVFLLLRRLTGAFWRSALVAAVFGLHPMHVESVAWIAERKDVLSACFGLLTLLFYARYAQKVASAEWQAASGEQQVASGESPHPACSSGPSLVSCVRQFDSPSLRDEGAGRGLGRGGQDFGTSPLNYLLSLFFFACGLMSKPMLVTWPFVMLLLDYWPLRRFKLSSPIPHPSIPVPRPPLVVSPSPCDEGAGRGLGRGEQSSSPAPSVPSVANNPCLIRVQSAAKSPLAALLLEKIPFFAFAAAASVVTLMVQKHEGALMTIQNLPLGARVGNALISYCRYLGKMFWPTDLAVFYPHPGDWPIEEVFLAGVLLLGISVLFIVERRRYPFLLMGWLWYCGTLVPVIGLVQVGAHAMADRYTYIPSVGLLLATVWGVHDLTSRWRYQTVTLAPAGAAAIVVCLILTRNQVGYWKDSETLFRHALAISENNYAAHQNLGVALVHKGQVDEAIGQFQETICLKPDDPEVHNNLGIALGMKGQIDKAIIQFQETLSLKPDWVQPRDSLGLALVSQGRLEEAIDQFQEALKLDPGFAQAHYHLGNALLKRGQMDEAKVQFEKAVQIQSDFADAHNNLGNLLLQRGQVDEAIAQFEKALAVRPRFADAHSNLGGALLQEGQTEAAIVQFQKALEIDPKDPLTRYNLGSALLKSGRVDEAIAQFQSVLELRPEFVQACSKLGSALLQEGRVDEAIAQFRRAVQLNPNLANVQSDLGNLLLQKGQVNEAMAHYQKALELQPANAYFLNNLAWVLATCSNAEVRNGARAVELAQKAEQLSGGNSPAILGTLAAAYAEAGRFAEAVRAAEHALELAVARTNSAQADMLRANIALFRAGHPFHEAGPTNISHDLKRP